MGVRRVRLCALALAVGLIGLGRGEAAAVYRRWRFSNTVLLGHRWLEAGRFERTADSVRQAWALDAKRPESWRLASELAWRQAQPGRAIEYAAKAAGASGYRIGYVLDWADLALGVADLTAAEQALAHLPSEELRSSARALRLAAQLAGRRGNYLAARDWLSAILALDLVNRSPELRSDEAQQGRVLLQTGRAADRRQGLELLERCAQDRGLIGRYAVRALVADSVSNPSGSSTLKWAQALLSHPLCTLDDTQFCLRAAAPATDGTFGTVFASARSKLATSQLRSAELLEWLGQCGRIKEALEWARAVNSADVTAAPLFVAVAETFRQASQWRDLENWTSLADWGSGMGLIQSTYRWMALSQLGEAEVADAEAAFAKLKAAAPTAGPETMMAAQLLYTWGQSERSAELLWLLSADPRLTSRALGMLIRHYQTQRDGPGLYRAIEAWRRLAAAGRKAEALDVLRSLDPNSMTREQAAWCAAVLHG